MSPGDCEAISPWTPARICDQQCDDKSWQTEDASWQKRGGDGELLPDRTPAAELHSNLVITGPVKQDDSDRADCILLKNKDVTLNNISMSQKFEVSES